MNPEPYPSPHTPQKEPLVDDVVNEIMHAVKKQMMRSVDEQILYEIRQTLEGTVNECILKLATQLSPHVNRRLVQLQEQNIHLRSELDTLRLAHYQLRKRFETLDDFFAQE